jgi:hypothetical protein
MIKEFTFGEIKWTVKKDEYKPRGSGRVAVLKRFEVFGFGFVFWFFLLNDKKKGRSLNF